MHHTREPRYGYHNHLQYVPFGYGLPVNAGRPRSADLFSPRLSRDFFIRIRNEAPRETTCDLVVIAVVYGP